MTLECHTLRWGTADWLDVCAPTLDAWCARHAVPLTIWDDTDRGYPCVKFLEIDILKQFLVGKSDFLIYLDADIWIHPDAPLPDLVPGLSMATDAPHREHNAHWTEWCQEHFGVTPEGFDYSNAGVWICDRAAAKQMLKQMVPPFIEAFQEQHQFCLWSYMATKAGMPFNRLPTIWNRYGEDHDPAWFRHIWGLEKMRSFRDLESSGALKHGGDSTLKLNFRPDVWPPQDKIVVSQFVKDCGLGNQLMELAAGLAVAKRLGLPFRWNWIDTGYRDFGLESFGLAKPKPQTIPIVSKKYGQGNRLTFERVVRDVDSSTERICGISGPFQDEQCFIDIKDEIKELFRLEPMDLGTPEGRTPVGVQVRRGDYVTHSRLNVCSEAYFRNAMTYIRETVKDPHFFIVSDDPKWCESKLGRFPNVTVMPPQSPLDGLRTLASCKAHVISNSTFGWWGAWLGETGPVVAPEIWYQGKDGYGIWDPVPPRWLKIPITGNASVEPIRINELLFTAPPTLERCIVYPFKSAGAVWEELRYSLRSVEAFFEDKDCPIFIFGTHKPEWLKKHPRVVYADSWTYSDAIIRGVQAAKEVLWMNDDICFLKPTSWEDCRTPRYLVPVGGGFRSTGGSLWKAGVQRVLDDLTMMGCKNLKIFSTHIPYVYRRDEAVETLRTFGVFEKIPFENAYFNRYAKDPQLLGDARTRSHEFGDARFLSYSDDVLTSELKSAIEKLLPDKAPWEMPIL